MPKEAEILIYDVVGQDFWGEGVTARSVVEQLADIDAEKLRVRINSPGGDAFDGFAIYNALLRHEAEVETHIDGLAASSAATIAMAGDRVLMAENAHLMIHKSWGLAMGNSTDMTKMAEQLEKLDGSIARTYSSKTGKSRKRVLELMAEETWFNSDEAKTHRFVDEITEKSEVENSFDLSAFRNVPKELKEIAGTGEKPGRSLHQEFESVEAALAAVDGFRERVRSLADLREQEGRTLSQNNRDRLSQLLSQLTDISQGIEGVLAETEPDKGSLQSAQLYARFQKTRFELSQLLRA